VYCFNPPIGSAPKQCVLFQSPNWFSTQAVCTVSPVVPPKAQLLLRTAALHHFISRAHRSTDTSASKAGLLPYSPCHLHQPPRAAQQLLTFIAVSPDLFSLCWRRNTRLRTLTST